MAVVQALRPATTGDLADAVADAVRRGEPLAIQGGGSKSAIGAPVNATALDMGAFAGVLDYDPAELVLTAGAATPLAEVEALLAGQGQMLAFEPVDHGPIFGRATGAATLGGIVAAGVSGPRRLSMGAVRDHLLGFRAVSGRGEPVVGGAKVVKNVTGYDLPKLMCGSWGRLAALTELTFKVMPAGRTDVTLGLSGLAARVAQEAMTTALQAPVEVACAAHLPASAEHGRPLTAFRLTGFEPSVRARAARLAEVLARFGHADRLAEAQAGALWREVREVAPLKDAPVLWRVSLPPNAGAAFVETMACEPQALALGWMLDWGGALAWLAFEGDTDVVRAVAAAHGGHAALVRAPGSLRAITPALHPEPPGVVALSERVRRAFDPHGVFETGRFLDAPHAH